MDMFFNVITWAVWGIGVAILIFWIIETSKEFKFLFSERQETDKKNMDKI